MKYFEQLAPLECTTEIKQVAVCGVEEIMPLGFAAHNRSSTPIGVLN